MPASPPPALTQFRIELGGNRIAHLVFDCPGRAVNVFSDAAIADLAAFVAWLPNAALRGVVIRSAKPGSFCAGTDLAELAAAHDAMAALPPHERFASAFDRSFRLSAAMRRLETAGTPVVAAIEGLALGAGCELAMAAHHRVLARDPAAAFGLPDVLVGLLPGAGGTQRLPRLVGMRAALPILLDAARLADGEALDAGLASELAEPGDAVARAEAWLLGDPDPVQPWDRADWQPLPAAEVSAAIAPVRTRILSKTLGHYPAPLAILDCVEFGLPQSLEGGIRSEAAIFAELIQREEPRNMIATMFTGRTDYERLDRAAALPTFVGEVVAAARQAIRDSDTTSLAGAGFWGMGSAPPARTRTAPGYWIDSNAPWAGPARVAVARIDAALAPLAAGRTPAELRLLDYAIVNQAGYPAYLGGPFARRARAAEDQSSA